jgi:hypothetical protein
LLLWLRGTADLRLTCVNSVAMVGSRAATAYGNHVAVEMAAVLAEHGVGVVSGGAYAAKAQQARTVLCKTAWSATPICQRLQSGHGSSDAPQLWL